MSQKVTLSVPDDLYEKMQQWKDCFNFSGTFQDVISKEIQRKEDFQKRLTEDSSMESVIERLKQEKQESTVILFDRGKEEALIWAKAAHYELLQIGVNFAESECYSSSPEEYEIDNFEKREEWRSYWREVIDRKKLDTCVMKTEDKKLRFGTYGTPIDSPGVPLLTFETSRMHIFVKGWSEAVLEFWNEIKGKI